MKLPWDKLVGLMADGGEKSGLGAGCLRRGGRRVKQMN